MSQASTRSTRIFRTDVGRKDWMDLVKGVAIIMVVVYHTMLFLRAIEYEGGGMGRVKIVLETFPMPAFFVIAGMFQLRVPQWSFAQTWHRRLATYLYLYVLWSTLRFVFYLVVPNVRSADGAGASASDPLSLLAILVWPSSSYWFIWALFVFTLLVWLMRRMPAWAQVAIAGVLSVLFSSGLLDVRNVGWNRMGEYLVFFVVGVLFSRRINDAVNSARWWHVGLAFAVFVVASAALVFMPVVGRIPGVTLVAQVASLVFGFGAAASLVRVRALSGFSYLGVRSLNVYLLHVFVIAGLVWVVSVLPIEGVFEGRGMLLVATVSALVVVISLLLYRVLSRFSWLFVSPFRQRPPGQRRRRGGAAAPGGEGGAGGLPAASGTPEPDGADAARAGRDNA